MKNIIISIFLILFVIIFADCASKTPMTLTVDTKTNNNKINSLDELELLNQTDCHFMGIRVLTLLPGKLKAQHEDETGIYFYAVNFKSDFNSYYTKAGIFIPKQEVSEAFAFAEKGSPNSLALLSCNNLNFTKTKIYDPSQTTLQQ